MNLSYLLNDDLAGDDNALETDVMRFMAIIGIIFWLLFALVHNIAPIKQSDAQNFINEKASVSSEPLPVPLSLNAPDRSAQMVTIEKPLSHASISSPAEASSQNQTKPQGVVIEFRSISDLYQLMADQKVTVYCRIQSAGFDLVFETLLQNRELKFKPTSNLPNSLWEIQASKERNHFLNHLLAANPSVGALPQRQVLVAFSDSAIDRRITALVDKAQSFELSGTISIDRKGDVKEVGEDLMGDDQ